MKLISNYYKFILFTILFLISCGGGKRDIVYNEDSCEHCGMLIVQKKFGAEYINENGKVYTFDSDECLIEYYIKNDLLNKGQLFVTNYTKGNLIDGTKAFYLIDDKYPSPMGKNLSSYENIDDAKKNSNEKIYNFDEIVNNFKKL